MIFGPLKFRRLNKATVSPSGWLVPMGIFFILLRLNVLQYSTHMAFQFHPASKQLEPYIKGYLEADYRGDTQTGEHTLFPNGYSGIFFNFGNLGRLILQQEYKTPRVSVFGQIDHHFTAISYPGYYSLGVLLQPTTLSWLLQLNMSGFTNMAYDGQLIDGDFKVLHEQMEESNSIKQKIKLFEKYFMRQLVRKQQNTRLADDAIALLQHEQTTIQHMAAQLQVSQRYLEIKFRQAVGLPVKTYSLILRFRKMEQQLKSLQQVHWPQMAFAHEYYDQNHFIKEFKRFTGHTPSDYLLQSFDLGRSYLVR